MALSPLLIPAFSIAASMAVIPIMIRLAGRLGLVDEPGPRKVHSAAVPRVGGWGMVLGTALAVAVFVRPLDPPLWCYLFGALVLLGFGTRDDHADIGHYPKFLGQLIAVVPLVTVGGVRVEHLPFLDAALPPSVAIPFTVFAMVGAINALNHSDGLDGLAGGEALLSLCVVALVGFSNEVPVVVAVATAAIGGIIGFLRFNTYPARVFMGDSGSQFLGFTLAFLVVYLMQRAFWLSAGLPALLLGLPIMDILAVLAQRIYHGLNWFKATRNHVHHRLLDLGLDHYESVVIIYGVQAFFVVAALFFQTQPNSLILGTYLGTCALLFAWISWAERRGWRVRDPSEDSGTSTLVSAFRHSWALTDLPLLVVSVGIPVYVLGSCALLENVPRDYGWYALGLFVVLLIETLRGKVRTPLGRVAIYAAALFVVILSIAGQEYKGEPIHVYELVFFGVLALAIGLGVRFSRTVDFGTTPLDYLVLFIVVLVALFPLQAEQTERLSVLVIEGFIILYGCEFLLNKTAGRWTPLSLASLGALAVIGIRGIGAT